MLTVMNHGKLTSLRRVKTSHRLQSVLNAAARLVFSVRKSEHITPLFRQLHWLRVPERIQFRLCALTYRCLNGTAPQYLAETLQKSADVQVRRRLRSAATSTLIAPSTRHSIHLVTAPSRLRLHVPGTLCLRPSERRPHCSRFAGLSRRRCSRQHLLTLTACFRCN